MPDGITRTQRADRFDLQALHETSRLLSGSLDLDFVLNNLLLTAMSKLLVTRGLVLIHEPVENGYHVAAVKGIAGLEPGAFLPLGTLPSDEVLRGDQVPEVLTEHGVRLVQTIRFGDREIGRLGLGPKATGDPFDERERAFMQSLIHMSSAAVHNSLMVEELQQANRDLDAKIQELNTLFDLSQEFNATLDRDRLVRLLSFALMGQLLIRKYLFLLRPQGGTTDLSNGEVPDLEVAAAKGVPRDAVGPELRQHLCTLDRIVLLEENDGDEAWSTLRERGLALLLPVRHQGETCGVLCLGPKMTGQPYSADDVEFLTALGNLAFVSIQNLHLVEEQIEKERLEKEMRLARDIQQRLLPQTIPSFAGLDVAAYARPSRLVGGDYFDVVKLSGDRGLLVVADVTGKGVPAALLMANLQSCTQLMVPMDVTLTEATEHTNRVICKNTDYDKFITFFQGIYEADTRRFSYVNAGHNPPMLVHADGAVDELETGGLLLGVISGATYEEGQVHLEQDDVLAIFTDGVTEAMSPDEEEYGEERLLAVLRTHRGESPQAILDAVLDDVLAFTHDPLYPSDDLTMIVAKAAG